MNIHGLPNRGDSPGEANPVQRQHVQVRSADDRANLPSPSASGDLLRTRSPEVQRLAAELSELPEVRPDKVASATERLASGYYLTTEAAEQTAGRLTR